MGYDVVYAPCLAIKPVAFKPTATLPAALIITSGQAVPAIPQSYTNLPIFCVGDATAGRLRAAGFNHVESASGDARDLFRLVTARRIPGLHVMAVGQRQGLALCRQLAAAGIQVMRRKAYSASALRSLPDAANEALAEGKVKAALFYSSETARAFLSLTPQGTAKIIACVLSPAIAEALNGLPWSEIRVALAPTEADLMALLP